MGRSDAINTHERSVEDIRVAGDPADVSNAGIDISVLVVEHVTVGEAPGRVQWHYTPLYIILHKKSVQGPPHVSVRFVWIGNVRVEEIAGGGVRKALGCAGRAGRVEQEEEILSIPGEGQVRSGATVRGTWSTDKCDQGESHENH